MDTVIVACVLRSGGVELVEQLGDVPMIPGVYEIVHRTSGKRYIGSAINIRKRWRSHLKSLTKETNQTSPKLRNAWQKYGPRAFEFRIIVLCEPDELLRLEKAMIQTHQAVRHGYNCRPNPESNLGIKFGSPSEETRRKIGRANAIALKGKRGPMKGRQHTRESRMAMSRTKRERGRKITYDGRSMCLTDWAEDIGITSRGLGNRLANGWSLERALTEPSRGY